MGWIFLAVSEESQKHSKDTLSPSLTVKMSDTRKRYSYREWLQEIFRLLQYGTTLKRSGEATCPGSILSTEVSPARTLVLQDAEKVWGGAEAVFFSRSSGSLAKYDPDSSSWKTSQRLLFEEQSESLESFAAYGMTVDGEFYPLQTWGRIIKENGGGYLPTPRETDGSGGAGLNRIQGALGLNDKRFQLREWVRAFPTPTTRDDRGPNSKQTDLNRVVKMFPTPTASAGGPDYAAKDRGKSANLSTAVGGNLNPKWTDWLMGYPCDWTALDASATQWFRPRREKPLKG